MDWVGEFECGGAGDTGLYLNLANGTSWTRLGSCRSIAPS